jgi:hypothetical protein
VCALCAVAIPADFSLGLQVSDQTYESAMETTTYHRHAVRFLREFQALEAKMPQELTKLLDGGYDPSSHPLYGQESKYAALCELIGRMISRLTPQDATPPYANPFIAHMSIYGNNH